MENDEPKTFVPPRHWIGVEQLNPSYWEDPELTEKRGQEFFDKPIEYLEGLGEQKTSMARREFLTIMGASMAMAGFSCARRPVHKIIPYVVKPEFTTPGVSDWYASTCRECSSGCGVLVKNREGRPIKLEGNPDHPLNRGSLCARGQASVLNLYDPDRLKAPLAVARGKTPHEEISWEKVDQKIQEGLKKSSRVRILSGAINSESTRELLQSFLAPWKAALHVEYEPISFEVIRQAQQLSYGTAVIPNYRFDQADMVLSLGADFLGNWVSPVEHARDWASKRKLLNENRMSRLICFEPGFSLTGSNADERYPIRPGEELLVALALAHELIIKQKRASCDKTLEEVLGFHTVERVSQGLGLEPSILRKVASELWEHRGRSLVVAGGLASQTSQALELQLVVNLLNSVIQNEGLTIDGTLNIRLPSTSATIFSLLEDMEKSQVEVLIVYRSNPAYTLPRFQEALKKVGLVVVVSDHLDETGRLADYVLPDHHFLENWGDSVSQRGLLSLQQPAIAPIHQTRAFEDLLMGWSRALQGEKSALGKYPDWHMYLKGRWKEKYFRISGKGGNFELFWESVLRQGVLDLRVTQTNPKLRPIVRTFRSSCVKGLIPRVPSQQPEHVQLALYAKVSVHDGRSANNSWLQELPDPLSSVTWDNYLNVSPSLAKKLSLKENDLVEISSQVEKARLPVRIQPGLHPEVVTAAIGYGRRQGGKVAQGCGVDMYPWVSAEGERFVFSGKAVRLKKTGQFYALASTQWHTATEQRPVIRDITLKEYQKNPHALGMTDPALKSESVASIWPRHDYHGDYRWGMGIDLSSCTGCGACVIACQAENNVPVVGRDQVRVSRQMHWMRIDRYYSGSPDNPSVVFQPMLCQHCENAPCETVCPVVATVHDDEGLNVQVYNRCVGTRYCQNNCPYKVRRFNFFDHWKSYETTMNLLWNPDVTVRTRGIMEKCTFCIQRIHESKDLAKDRGEKVQESQLKTACQQTCPTQAIVFGNLNEAKSTVSQWKEHPRAFKVLEVLNTEPSISYLAKVRNP